MKDGRTIACVIPALNEQAAIGKVLAEIPRWVDQVVVVDNGSSDGTADAARAGGAEVVHEAERGYGAACLAGLRHLHAPDIVVFLDGDYSDHPAELDRIVAPILAGRCDMVIGSRSRGEATHGALTPQQRFGNWFACKLMNGLWRTCYTDLGPFRAIDATALRRLGMSDRSYGWTAEMQIKAALAGLHVSEVPVSYRARIGQSKISGTVKGTVMAGIKIIGMIGRMALMHGIAPIRGARARAHGRAG